MSEKASQFRIGIFVVVGVAILLAALFLFGIRSAFQPTYTLETYVPTDVEGLSVGSVVKLRGVTVGKVTEIGFSWNMYEVVQPAVVVVRFHVKQHISPQMFRKDFDEALAQVVNQGLRAVVQGQGITGTSIVSLQTLDPKAYPPLQFPWTPKYPYIPSAPSQLGQILASVDKTLSNLSKLDIDRLVKSLDGTLTSASRALDRLSDLDVKGISTNAIGVLSEASTAIREVEVLVQEARAAVQSLRLGTVSDNANRLLDDLDARLTSLLDRLSAIDVRSLNDTLAGTREAAQSLNEVLDELKRYPSGFLLGGAPPPAPGLQKQKEKK
jgi:phospholipid/cholesterol/gamma-HCH transport system substrate-binding protein